MSFWLPPLSQALTGIFGVAWLEHEHLYGFVALGPRPASSHVLFCKKSRQRGGHKQALNLAMQ